MRPHRPLSPAVGWVVLFSAVIGHLPALASYFAQDDWAFLARAAGQLPVPEWPPRPVSAVLAWKLLWPLFGLQAAAYHTVALLLAALLALQSCRLAGRFGLGPVGATLAGLTVAGTPVVLLPIAWASAAAELGAALLALVALELWLLGGARRTLAVAVLLPLAALSKENALFAWALLPVAGHWFGVERPTRPPWLRGLAVGLGAAASFMAALLIWRNFGHGPAAPYALGGPLVVLGNLASLGGWILSPWRHASPDLVGLRILGAGFWIAWALLSLRAARRDDLRPAFGLLWALATVAPVLGLREHLYPYYLVGAVPALGWGIGGLLGPWIERRVPLLLRPGSAGGLALLVAALATAGLGWASARDHMGRRGQDGQLVDPILRRSAIAAESARLIQGLPLAPGQTLGLLQATRVAFPDELEGVRETVILRSELHAALDGSRGLNLLLPEGVAGRWISHLDGLEREDLVLLDAGDPFFRVLGDVDNARIYSALIAVAAGQYDRARHDLWNVVGPVGSQVRFAYDADALPLDPSELDSQVRGFVAHLTADGSPSSLRILRLFEQLYEAVRGQSLYRSPWGEPLRSGSGG